MSRYGKTNRTRPSLSSYPSSNAPKTSQQAHSRINSSPAPRVHLIPINSDTLEWYQPIILLGQRYIVDLPGVKLRVRKTQVERPALRLVGGGAGVVGKARKVEAEHGRSPQPAVDDVEPPRVRLC